MRERGLRKQRFGQLASDWISYFEMMTENNPKPEDAKPAEQHSTAAASDPAAIVPPDQPPDDAFSTAASRDPFSTLDSATSPPASPSAEAVPPSDPPSFLPTLPPHRDRGSVPPASGTEPPGGVPLERPITILPGETLGRFRLLRQLGSGGMGVVYEAEPIDGGPRVALKTISPGASASLARFKSEFRVLADLSHPNLVRLGELDTTAAQPFFTMEVVRGCTLDQYVRSSFESAAAIPQVPFNEARLRDALRQLTEGLLTLHRAGCIHRDIKPSNVLVSSEGRVVILDFGIAVDLAVQRERGGRSQLMGTPYFMAPELADGGAVTPASDWYSVGVMLFEALTGERAFHGHRFDLLQQAKKNPARPDPKSIVSQIPDDLNRLCVALMQPRAADRPDGESILRQLLGSQGSASAVAGAARAAPTAGSGEELWIGRQKELERLHTAWGEVIAGRPRVVLVSGISGLGKTSLVDHFLVQLRRREPIVVLRGRCYESESVAYPGFDSVVDSLATYLSGLSPAEVERVLPLEIETLCRIFPVLAEVPAIAQNQAASPPSILTPQELRQQGMTALRELLCRLARWTKLVLFIDDLQQGDADTAALFCELFRRGQVPRALVLATFRSEDEPTSDCLRRIREDESQAGKQGVLDPPWEVVLDRLEHAESVQLCLKLLSGGEPAIRWSGSSQQLSQGSKQTKLAERIANEARGDPLFIRLLANHFLNEQRQATDTHLPHPAARLPAVAASQSVGEGASGSAAGSANELWTLVGLIDRQFEQMTLQERAVLRRLAAAGRPVDDRVLELAELSDGPVITAGTVRGLMIRRWVRRLGGGREIEVFHDKIRETILAKMTPEQLRTDCLTLAQLLERETAAKSCRADAELLADLFRRGGAAAQSARYCIEAAAKFDDSFAFRRAVQAYQWAIEQLDPESVRQLGLREKLGHSLANASRSAEAAEQFLLAADDAARRSGGDADRLHLRQLAALRLLISGHIDRGVEILQEVLGEVGLPWPKSTTAAVAGLLWRNARLRIGNLRCNHDAAQLGVKQRQKLDVCWTAAAGLSVVDPIRGAMFVSENLILSLKSGRSPRLGRDLAAYMGHVAIGGSASRGAIRRVLLASRQLVPDRREPYQAAMLLLARGIAALLRGKWSSSIHCCDLALTRLEDPSCHGASWERSTARTFALWALQYQGNLPELARRQPDLLRFANETNDLFATLNYGTQVMAHLELSQDRPDESLRRLDEDRGRLSQRGFFVQHHNELLARTYTLIYLGEGQAAMELIHGRWGDYRQAFLSHVQQMRIDHFQVCVRAILAAAEQSDQPHPLVAQARRLVARLQRERVAWAIAIAVALDAACDSIAGDMQGAEDKLRRAVAALDAVQMRLFAAAAEQHLAALSHRVGGPEPAASFRWNELGVKNPAAMAATLLPGFT